ncbi:MAG: YciI family protein [Myxococcaceae bacterium]
MRFMMVAKSDEKIEAGALPDAKLVAAMGRYHEELAKAGALLSADGLLPSSKGARVRFSEGKTSNGPFPGAGELIAGYWLIQAKSKEEAIEWAKRVPFEEGVIEIRQVEELSDFPAELQAAAANEPALRAKPEKRGA